MKSKLQKIFGDGRAFDMAREGQHRYAFLSWCLYGCPNPPPNIHKRRVISKYAKDHGIRTLIETGTYFGDTINAVSRHFDEIHSIEMSEYLANRARGRFKNSTKISIHCGDSAAFLPIILEKIESPALFWLDAHYSGGITARGDSDTPISKELEFIFQHAVKGHVILIDDARDFLGTNGYPTIDFIRELTGKNPAYSKCEVESDIIRIE
jgi:hypothetical protein